MLRCATVIWSWDHKIESMVWCRDVVLFSGDKQQSDCRSDCRFLIIFFSAKLLVIFLLSLLVFLYCAFTLEMLISIVTNLTFVQLPWVALICFVSTISISATYPVCMSSLFNPLLLSLAHYSAGIGSMTCPLGHRCPALINCTVVGTVFDVLKGLVCNLPSSL